MTFEEWYKKSDIIYHTDEAEYKAEAAWNAAWEYQQNHIEKLEWNLNNVKHALEEQKKLNSVLNGRLGEHDRYELEQAIMSCWGITDDLHLLADAMESGDSKRMHNEMLLNLSQLYELKFQKLFKEFEKFTGCY